MTDRWTTGKTTLMLEAFAVRASVNLPAAYADIFESHGAEPDRVEKVLGIDNEWTAQGLFDAIEVQSTKFRPTCADH